MKNIETILAESGVQVTEEQKVAINKGIAENYKTVNEFNSKVTKLEGERDSWKNQYDGVKTSLDKFNGVDLDAMKQQVADAQAKAQKAEEDAKEQLAARDYADTVKASTAGTKFSSNAAQRDFMHQLEEKKLQVSDGKLLGFSDFLEQYKKDNPGAIVDEQNGQKAQFTGQMNQSTPPADPKDAEFEKKMREVMGIPEEQKKE